MPARHLLALFHLLIVAFCQLCIIKEIDDDDDDDDDATVMQNSPFLP